MQAAAAAAASDQEAAAPAAPAGPEAPAKREDPLDQNGCLIRVGDVVMMFAKKNKAWYDNKRATVVRINSKVVVVQLLEGEMKGSTKKTPFESLEIVEPANPAKKPRVDAPEPEVEEPEVEEEEGKARNWSFRLLRPSRMVSPRRMMRR